MKPSRRGIFGIWAGAVAATALPAESYPTSPPNVSQQLSGATKAPSTFHELARLKRIVSGELTEDEEHSYPTIYSNNAGRYDVLKSISPQVRYVYARRYEHEQHKRSVIERAIKQLAEYDKTGILRWFS